LVSVFGGIWRFFVFNQLTVLPNLLLIFNISKLLKIKTLVELKFNNFLLALHLCFHIVYKVNCFQLKKQYFKVNFRLLVSHNNFAKVSQLWQSFRIFYKQKVIQ